MTSRTPPPRALVRSALRQGLILGIGLWAGLAAQAAELQLFGLDLANASDADFRRAAAGAGAKASGKRNGAELFQVASLGLPGIRTMEVTMWRGRVMAVQYSQEDHQKHDEALRRMLVSKYGQPQERKHTGFSGSRSFTDQFIDDGSYIWRFDGGMQLVYKKPFGWEAPTLSYLNPRLLAEAEAAAERSDTRRAREAAGRQSGNF